MLFDLATPLLGGFAGSLDAAFGGLAGWIVGHLIILALATLVVLAARRSDALVRDLDLSAKRVGWWSLLVLITAGQHVFYATSLGFPFVGALSTAVGATLFIAWSVESMAPARA